MKLKVQHTGLQDSSGLPSWTVPEGTKIVRKAKPGDMANEPFRIALIEEPDGKQYWLSADGSKTEVPVN
jgi:hypothetical protein